MAASHSAKHNQGALSETLRSTYMGLEIDYCAALSPGTLRSLVRVRYVRRLASP